MSVQAQVSSPSEQTLTWIGAWPIEVADAYPTARVIGLDLAPIQPDLVPLNCEFMVADLTQDLDDFDDGSVDLLQSRYAITSALLNSNEQLDLRVFEDSFMRVWKGINGQLL